MKIELFLHTSCKIVLPTLLTALVLLTGAFLLPLSLWGRAAPPPAAAAESQQPSPAQPADQPLRVRLLTPSGAVETLDLEDYVWSVTAAEMPASFPLEALKAQAVAARTYTLQRLSGSSRHPGADLCADSACCQACRTPADARAAWGENADRYAQKLTDAVRSTAGEYLAYGGQPIRAVFHSSSDGLTADALTVWGAAAPYLVSVPTPETADDVPNFESTVALSPADFAACFIAAFPAAQLTGDPAGWFRDLQRSPWGGVEQLTVGGVTVTGAQLRRLLSLRSTRFTVDSGADAVVFSVTAYGHGVGMSQYGARAMAGAGADYRAILAHYYPGTQLETP